MLFGQQPQPAPLSRIAAVDQGEADASFREFRELLLQAIAKRDLTQVLGMTSADVQVTLAGRKGIPALRRMWRLDQSPDRFLRELEAVLKLGGRFSSSSCTFVAPYVWTEFPESLHTVDYLVVVNPTAAIFDRPGAGSRIAEALRGDLLRSDLGVPGWMNVTTADGKEGYVKLSDVRMPHGFRAYFTKIMEEWRMVGFFEGVD